MGAMCGKSSSDDAANREIDNQLKKDQNKMKSEVKLLLLGAGESGKSTVLKQMKILHQGGYSDEERESYREIIWSNCLQSMQVLLRGMGTVNPPIPFNDEDAEKKAQLVLALSTQGDDFVFTPEIAKLVRELWGHKAVRATFDRANELQLNDSAK